MGNMMQENIQVSICIVNDVSISQNRVTLDMWPTIVRGRGLFINIFFGRFLYRNAISKLHIGNSGPYFIR